MKGMLGDFGKQSDGRMMNMNVTLVTFIVLVPSDEDKMIRMLDV